MEFLNGPQAIAKIAGLTAKSRNVRMAVAFWGEGAAQWLGLLSKPSSAIVICNLKMGGTNPAEIRALMNAGVHVSQSDILHAKVYLFDNQVIIGSSNASANGLSLQGGETSGWIEANVFCDEAAFCQKASRWFAKLTTQIITEDDLKNAEEIWLRRRANIQVAIPKGGTLVDALKFKPASYKNRKFYLCAYSAGLDAAGEKAFKKEERAHPSQGTPTSTAVIDAFQDWSELPDDAILLCFFVGSAGNIRCDGFREMPRQRREIKVGRNSSLRLCFVMDKIEGFAKSKIGAVATWRQALVQFKKRLAVRPQGTFFRPWNFWRKVSTSSSSWC
jgi:hypothetical protein